MKRIFTSATAVGIGVLGLTNVEAQEPPQERLWNFRAKLRGFYDDNYGTLSSSLPQKDASYGIEVNPVGTYQNQGEGPTRYSVEYDYRLRYFEGRAQNQIDNQHKATLQVVNSPNDRLNLQFNNTFAFAQEPGVNEAVVTAPVRTQGSYFRNRAQLAATYDVSSLIDLRAAYENRIQDFQQDGVGSRSALLDNVIHQPSVDVLWKMSEKLTTITGVQYTRVSYTSKDPIGNIASGAARTILPEERDSDNLAAYVGIDRYRFTETFEGTIKAGFERAHFRNAGAGADDSFVVPFVQSVLSYRLPQNSIARAGVRYGVSQTDVALNAAGAVNPVQATKTLTVHGDVTYSITAPLNVSLVWQIQQSDFEGGAFDGSSDGLYTGGLTFGYEIWDNLNLETGYLVDRLDSDIPTRSFTRHRGFIGLNYSY